MELIKRSKLFLRPSSDLKLNTLIMDYLVNIFSIFAAVATIVTAIIAGTALSDWKKQIHYNLIMEAKANSRIAIDIIETLRNPFGYGEMNIQMRSRFIETNGEPNPIEDQYLLFRSRLLSQAEYYKPILIIREKSWASLGETHEITLFFDEIIATIQKIEAAHRRRIALYEDRLNNEPEFTQLYRVEVYHPDNDEISLKLNTMLDKIKAIK